MFLVAEAQGTRKELGWNRRKREAEITQPFRYLLVGFNSHAKPNRGTGEGRHLEPAFLN